MTKFNPIHYLQQDNKTLSSLLAKINQLQQWNGHLRECLGSDNLLLQHCQIANVSGTVLIIIADGPHWVTRLRFHIPELLSQLQHYPSLAHIKGICCKVQPARHAGIQKTAGNRPQLSQKSASLLQEAALKIQDERLRSILNKIALRALEKD